MTQEQENALYSAWDWCDEQDKSTEFMLVYMADVAKIEFEEVVDFVSHTSLNDRLKHRNLDTIENEEYNGVMGGDKLVGFYADVLIKEPNNNKTERCKILKYKRFHKRSKNKYLVKTSTGEMYFKFSRFSNITRKK